MDYARDTFTAGRRDMIDAFVKLSDLARRAGVDHDEITLIHGQFFDGNVAIKKAFRIAVLLAEIRRDPTMVTAKIVCQSKTESGEGDERQATVIFAPDYADGRNKEWSLYTPALSLTMNLKGAVADRFEQGKAYTLQFVEEWA